MTHRNFDLEYGPYQARVSDEGAALKTLHYKGVEIVSVPLPLSDFSFAGSTIAPWPNRLEDGSWTHDGRVLQGDVNEKANNNALHGLTVKSIFEQLEQTPSSVTLGYVIEPSKVYPFRLQCLVTYRLEDNGLTCSFSAVNLGESTAPVAYASHPYFALDGDSELMVSGTVAALNSERKLPIGEQPLGAIGLASGEYVPVSSLRLDDCVQGFVSYPALTKLTRPAFGLEITVWQDSACQHQMLFTRRPRVAGDYPDLLAIEPQTAPANAFRSGTDLAWLAKGAKFEATWGIRVS